MFDDVAATDAERAESRRGDDLVAPADVVMDRAFTVPGTPDQVWPWIVQLGKWRAGWYLSRRIERLLPPGRRAIRTIDPRWQELAAGDVIPDYGGRDETFTVAEIEPPHVLVYRSTRREMRLTWSISLRADEPSSTLTSRAQTRVLLRLRMAPIKRIWLARSAGELLDPLTINAMASGLRERLTTATTGP